MADVDLAIIGTGSGNSILDERHAGWRVAIIEAGTFGGTCLNVGCIPTKMLVHPADVVVEAATADRLGLDLHLDGVRWTDVRDRVFGRIDPIVSDGEAFRRSQPKVEVVTGTARFAAPDRLVVNGPDGPCELTAEQIVIAAGARPHLPAVEGLSEVAETSDTIMRRDEVPERLLVLGGGFIGAELSHVFASFGSRVTIATRGDRLLGDHDEEVAAAFTAIARRRHDVRLGTVARRARRRGRAVVVELSDGDEIEVDSVLVATGRVPNSDTLDLPAAGVTTHPDGRIRTDEHLRTATPGVWAMGDIRAPRMLKHVANHEARVVAHNLVSAPGDLRAVEEATVPHAVFGHPQVAAVGATHQALRAAGVDALVGRRRYADTAAGWAYGDPEGFAKVLVDPGSGLILGAHILGPHAAIVLQPLVQAMRFGQTAAEVARGPMYPHPALSELVEQVLLEAMAC